MMRIAATLVALIVLVLPTGHAAAQAYGTELPFVLGSDARVSAMGSAGVSLGGSASMQYYNPAAMSHLQWSQFSFFRTVLFESDAVYHSASYGHPLLNYGVLGITMLRLDVGGIEERDANNQLLSADLKNAQTRILLGYSKEVTSSVSAGINIKIDNQSFGSSRGTGVGLDFGIAANRPVSRHSFIRGIRGGFAIQNLIEPAVKLDQERVADPMQVALGLTLVSAYGGAAMETAIDLVSPRFSPTRLYVGQEVQVLGNFSFRAGVDGTSPALGMGATYKSAALDYAYSATELGGNHQFSLSLRLGSSVTQRKSRARARLEQEVSIEINNRMAQLERAQIASALRGADSLFALGEYGKAAARCESALLWDPTNERAETLLALSDHHRLFNDGSAAHQQDDFVQALFYYKQALELMPDDREAAAMVDMCNREITESRRSTEMANSLLKTSIDFYANREFAKALAGFNELIRLDLSNEIAAEYQRKCQLEIHEIVQAHMRVSKRAAQRGDHQLAIDELQQALVYEPNNNTIKATIASLQRERDSAVRTRVTPPDPPAPAVNRSDVDRTRLEAKYERGMEYFSRGEFDTAIGLFMEVWTVNPGFHDVSSLLTKSHLLVGMRLYALDEYRGAIDAWKKALVIDPDNVKVRRYLDRANAEFKKSKAYNE